MSNIDTRWEQALLNKVTSKGERIAVIERDVKEIKDNSVKTNESISALQENVSNLQGNRTRFLTFTKVGIENKRLKAGWDNRYLETVLSCLNIAPY